MANERENNASATGCTGFDRLTADAPRLGGEVRDRLGRFGWFHSGRCLPAAVVGAAVLGRAGYDATYQAGMCYWRRVPAGSPAAARAPEMELFGYEWDTDHPQSVAAVAANMMPCFHSWVAVRFPGGAVAVVDFAAHWMPEQVEEIGMTWEAARPPYPAVVRPDDMTHETGIVYRAEMEAIVLSLLTARQTFAHRAAVCGEFVGDLLPVLDPTGAGPVFGPMSHLLALARRSIRRGR